MKQKYAGVPRRTVGLCLLAATLLLGSVVAKADAVLDWNEIAVNTAVTNGQNPFAQARTAAIVQLAVFEAVNSIAGDYRPYIGTIIAPRGASANAAAIEAAYQVLHTYFSGSASTLDPARESSLSSIPDGDTKTKGIATGDAAAAAMIALRANDGSAPAQFKVPGPALPGAYQATPSCPIVNGVAVGAFFHWQNVTPFGIRRASDYLLSPPPALASNAYAMTYNEVMTVGSATSTERPQDRADVVHTSMLHLRQPRSSIRPHDRVAQPQQRTMSENARALALINMAISDSLVASFYNKYHYNFWRPETAIRAGATDSNSKTEPDPDFMPFIVTPCFPSYPSNHGSGSGGEPRF